VLGVVRPEPAAIEALIGSRSRWSRRRTRAARRSAARSSVGRRGRLAALAAAALAGIGAVAASTLLGLALFSWCHFGLLERASRPAQVRAAVAFAFGLVHGFGFAGVLAEMELPTDRLVAALFGFNAGVEVASS